MIRVRLDGRKSGAYCQNLCYMAKLFLDHKVGLAAGWVGGWVRVRVRVRVWGFGLGFRVND